MGILVKTFIKGTTGNHLRYFHIGWVGGKTVMSLKLKSTKECVNHIIDTMPYLESITEISRYRYYKIHDTT